METMFAYCKFQVEGVHCWADAINYLKHPHRHMFHFKVKVEVKHADREVEFIALKHELRKNCPPSFSSKSCEQLASGVVHYLCKHYGNDRTYIVDVSEDGENGALVIYEPEEPKTRLLGEQLRRYDLSLNVTGAFHPNEEGAGVSLNLEAIARSESTRFGAHSFKMDVTAHQWKAVDNALGIAMKEVMDADSSNIARDV